MGHAPGRTVGASSAGCPARPALPGVPAEFVETTGQLSSNLWSLAGVTRWLQ